MSFESCLISVADCTTLCRQFPELITREAISKTQFYKPGPGMLAPGGARGSAPWYWQYPSISEAPKYAGFFHEP